MNARSSKVARYYELRSRPLAIKHNVPWIISQSYTDLSSSLERRMEIGNSLVRFSAVLPVNGDFEGKISEIDRGFFGALNRQIENCAATNLIL